MTFPFTQTRDVVRYFVKYAKGELLDFGAGQAKYKTIFSGVTSAYTSFDETTHEGVDVQGDVLEPTALGDRQFDTLLCNQVLEHVEDGPKLVANIFSLLKPEGVCLLTVPFMAAYHAHPHDYRRYTVTGLRQLFEKAGFEVVECGSYGKCFTVLSEMFRFIFFNPYRVNASFEFVPRNIAKLAKFLDCFVKNKDVYANVYMVARKPRAS